MVNPPVALSEMWAHLNYTGTPSAGDETEMWGTLLAATRLVENRVGAMVPRLVVVRLPTGRSPYLLPQTATPILELVSVATWPSAVVANVVDFDVDATAGVVRYWPGAAYDLTLLAGRDPVPEDLMEATKIVTAQMWEAQRASASTRGGSFGSNTGTDGQPLVSRGYAIPNRAVEAMAGHERLMFS